MQSGNRRLATSSVARAVSAVLWAAAAFAPATLMAQEAAAPTEEKKAEDVTALSDLEVTEDPMRALSNEPTGSSFGFSKPPLETPRTVSFVSEEQLSLFGVSTVQDLVRVVPGVYTTTRYGLQGGINVRAVTADQYFRGMKRLSLQGHVRTVLSAMDSIEVVKGPPSPLYGMGRIGGYSNLIPKSSRAKTGKYLTEPKGFLQATAGSYNKTEFQFGVGGPMKVLEKEGGYYVFGLVENSNSFVEQVGARQKFVQATTSIDNIVGNFRLEMGGQLQQSITSGAYMNRATQKLIDNGTYVSGTPLVNLDLDADGGVSYLESYVGSPVTGTIAATNQALSQRITASTAGGALTFAQAPSGAIPLNMKNYLLAHTEIQCSMADYMRRPEQATFAGIPGTSRELPLGFVLNPCDTKTQQVNYRRNGSFEREQNGKQNLIYIDLINDSNPDFTVKNQLFYDRLDTFKDSNLPYGEKQDIHAFEEKVTITKRIPDEVLPGWLRINSLGSVNYRDTRGNIRSSGGDFDYRQDVMSDAGSNLAGHLYSNTIFWNQLNDQSYLTGADDTTNRTSAFTEMGIGLLFDIDIGKKTNVVLGGRFDKSKARAEDFPDFLATAGSSGIASNAALQAQLTQMRNCNALATSASQLAAGAGMSTTINGQQFNVGITCPGAYLADGKKVRADDDGPSYSVSVSHQLPFGIRPYATYAKSSLTLDGSNNILQPSVVAQKEGFIGEAELKEIGIKNGWFNNKLTVTIAGYQQTRTDVRGPDDPGAAADVSSTEYKGVEASFAWAPIRNLYMGGYVLSQKGKYTVDAAFNAEVDGRALGFSDIVDPTGKVYPAEAFLYGGRFAIAVPAGSSQFRDRTGDPEVQAGFNTTYRFENGWGFLASSNYFEGAWADRIKTMRLPSVITVDAGITYDTAKWHLKASVYNLTDERYWQARSADTNPIIVTAKPGATWEMMLKYDF